MIHHGRPTITEADVALRAGVPLSTWKRRDAPAFRDAVDNLLTGRFALYDEAQALAYLAGEPLPALPADPHNEDLLTDVEVGQALGIPASDVRSHAARGYIGPGLKRGGARVWPRAQVDDRAANAPGQGAGGGRPTKPHPYAGDARLDTAAAALAVAPGMSRAKLAAQLAERHNGSVSTWERILAAARAQMPAPDRTR